MYISRIDARRRAPGRRRIVGVMGSGDDTYREYFGPAAHLGRWIAEAGYDLLTGAGAGMMAAVSQAFHETPGRAGLVIGVLPALVPALSALERRDETLPAPVDCLLDEHHPNAWVELAICTHLPHSGRLGTSALSRNHINVLSSDVVVALPGGEGTYSEAWLAVKYGVPVMAYHPAELALRLPPGVPKTSALEAVQQFVQTSIA